MDDNQIQPPPSFLALYATPSGLRLREPMDVVRQRYELCEDLAQALTEQASTAQFRTGVPEERVLASIRSGLASEGSAVSAQEAQWVTTRLAELLGWPMPAADGEG